jgi:hypothetical protein
MAEPFYEKAGSLLSPGDFFDRLPYHRVPKPLRVARKITLPKSYKIPGEVRVIHEVGRDTPKPDFNFDPPGEEILSNAKMAKAVFLTWGSEVEDDERSRELHKKDWLIAPVFPLSPLEGAKVIDPSSGSMIRMVDAIRTAKSPKFFPLPSFPNEGPEEYYVDFKKICPLAATHFQGIPRQWRLSRVALNDFYHQLIWFFTRKQIFFEPIKCKGCGNLVDLGLTFEGQAIDPAGGD